MSKRVLITGASGMIGKSLKKAFLLKGYQVNVLSTKKINSRTDTSVRNFYWDPENNYIDIQSLEGVNYIINLAGSPITQRWSNWNKIKIIKSRVKSLEILSHTIKTHNFQVKKLISASAIGIYPDSMSHIYSEENTKFQDNSFLSSVVLKWEAAARSSGFENLETTIMRIGVVLGKDGGALPKIKKPINLYLGAIFSSGKQWQSWIHIDDLISMILYVLKNDIKGTINAVAPNPVTQHDFTMIMAKILKKPILLPKIPALLLRLIFGEMVSILINSHRVSANKIKNLGFKFKYPELPMALQDLLIEKTN